MAINNNPWPGLSTYPKGTKLYGRDTEIRQISQYVLSEREILFYGKSGIGKSSILNCGVIPNAERSGFLSVKIRLSHTMSDASYVEQISESINKVLTANGGKAVEKINKIKGQQRTLWDYFHNYHFVDRDGETQKLLIILDQFEEIFTLQHDVDKKLKFFDELSYLINDIKPNEESETNETEEDQAQEAKDMLDDILAGQTHELVDYVKNNDVHFIITIRDDFLSEFEFFTSGIPSLRTNRFGLRPVDESQAAQIMMQPVSGLISEDVAKLILQDITGQEHIDLKRKNAVEVDVAILSLFLNKMYEQTQGHPFQAEMVENRVRGILKDFYREKTDKFGKYTLILEKELVNIEHHRENKSRNMLERQVPAEILNQLIEDKILCEFKRGDATLIEIVHDKLCSAINDVQQDREKEKVKKYKRYTNIIAGILLLFLACSGIFFLIFNSKEMFTVNVKFDVDGAQKNSCMITIHMRDSDYTYSDNLCITLEVEKKNLEKNDTLYYTIVGEDGVQKTCMYKMDLMKKIPKDPNVRVINVPVPIDTDVKNKHRKTGVVMCEGKPVPNILVVYGDYSTSTDNKGEFKFPLNVVINPSNKLYIGSSGDSYETYCDTLSDEQKKCFTINNNSDVVINIQKSKRVDKTLDIQDNDKQQKASSTKANNKSLADDYSPFTDEELGMLKACSMKEEYIKEHMNRAQLYRNYYFAIHNYSFRRKELQEFFSNPQNLDGMTYTPTTSNYSLLGMTKNEQNMVHLISTCETKYGKK